METVIVAFENNKNALRVKEILEEDGAADCLVCRTADQVRRASRQFRMPVVVCGYKLGDQTAQLIFDDLPACAMLVLARQDVLELMDNDEIFRLPAQRPGWTCWLRYECCFRWDVGWNSVPARSAARRNWRSSVRPRRC